MKVDISQLLSSEELIDKKQVSKLKEIIQKSIAPSDANNDPFEKLNQRISELTVDNFSDFIMSFFRSNRSDVQRTWFHFDNPKSKEIAEKINDFITNLTPDQV